MLSKLKIIYFCQITLLLMLAFCGSSQSSSSDFQEHEQKEQALYTKTTTNLEEGYTNTITTADAEFVRIEIQPDGAVLPPNSNEVTGNNTIECCANTSAIGCMACCLPIIAGVFSIPPILAYLSDQSHDLALASGIVNSIYLGSLCLNKSENENSKRAIVVGQILCGPLLIVATTYSWLYYVNADSYDRNVNCATAVSYAVVAFSMVLGTLCYSAAAPSAT